MEYALLAGGAYLIYNWYQKTFVKPVEEAKEFIEEKVEDVKEFIDGNFVEPIKENSKDVFEKTVELSKDAFEAGKESTTIQANFIEGVGGAAFEGNVERIKASIAGGKEAVKHIQPVTKEVEHSFEDGIEGMKEDTKDVPKLTEKAGEDMKKGNIKESARDLAYADQTIRESFDKQASKGAENIGGETAKAGKKVSEDFKETVDKRAKATKTQGKKTKQQFERTGNAIGKFIGL